MLINQELDEDPVQDQEAEEAEEPEVLPSAGLANEDLDDELVKAFQHLTRQANQQEQYDRRVEVLRDRRNRYYERGYQHLVEQGRTGVYTLGQPGQSYTSSDGEQIQCPNFIDDYNIFQPFGRTIQAIMTQNEPGIVFEPNDPKREEDQEASDTAEVYRKYYDRNNDVKRIQTQIVRMMLLSGRTISWTRTEANAELYGYTPDGEAKQIETTSIFGTLESKVPVTAKDSANCWYILLTDDPDLRLAKQAYPQFRDKIKPGMSALGESTYERIARLGVMQGTRTYSQINDSLTHLVTRTRAFFRPSAFEDEYFDKASERDKTKKIRDRVLALFPRGCLVVFVGDVYVGSRALSVDDEVEIRFPYEGDGMNRMAIMDPMIVVQDRFNDNMNAAAEVWDYGWPSTWVNADEVEFATIQSQRADPYAVRPKKARANQSLDAEFYTEEGPELPASFIQFIQMLQGELAQFIVAAPPALFGGAMEDQKTASGYAQARNQAMGQQGLVWQQIQGMFARIYYQAAMCATTNDQYDETIVIPSDNGAATLQLAKLTQGTFGVFPDVDSSYPETTHQKRQTLTNLVSMAAQSPVGQQVFDSPENWQIMKALMGIPELVLPEASARNKQLLEIEELLKGAPIPPDPNMVVEAQVQHAAQATVATHSGMPLPPFQPPQPEPSVAVDPDFDYHLWEFKYCQEWLSSDAARREAAKGNLAGIQNIKLHAMQHKQFAMMQMAPAPAPLPGAAPTPHPPPPPAANPNNPQSTPVQ
jgi:hypothetical protein